MSMNKEMGLCRRAATRCGMPGTILVSGNANSTLIRSIIGWFLSILLIGFAGSAWAQSISDSPNSRITVIQGNTATSTITASGFVSTTFISFSISAGLPSGTTASFSPSSITGNGSTTLTLAVGSSTPAGNYDMTVRANYGTRSRTTTVQIRVIVPDFSMTLSQNTVRITQGGANSTTSITTTATSGFNSDIAFTISGLPAGVTATFIPDLVAAPGSGSAILRLDVSPTTTAGNYLLTITGTGGGKTKTASLTLTVNSVSGGWSSFNYVYDSPDDAYSNGCTANYPAAENCTLHYPWDTDWRMRAAAVNVLYYDPASVYSPWPGFLDASFIAVRSNPRSGQAGYGSIRDLTGLVYEVAVDDSGFSGSRPQRGTNSNKTTNANGLIDLWDTHKRYTVNANSITVATYTYNNVTSTSLNPTISTITLSDSATCYTELGGGDVSCRTIAQAKQNIANWYQYYRRRSFVAKSAISNVVTGSPYYRYGLSVINRYSSLFQEMPTATPYSTHNGTLLGALYDYIWTQNGTPLQSGLNVAGQYYRGTLTGRTSPITSSCQQNFTVLLTDGYWNGAVPSGIGDADNDGFSVTLADVARYYYTTDLSGLSNNVPVTTFDTANWQHMVTFGVSFGIQGDLIDTDSPGDGWPNPILGESDSWGNPTSCSDCPEKVDDIWHAAYNSRGTFVAAQTPADVEKALSSALSSIGNRLASSAAIATNSTRLDTDTLIYQAQFNNGDWSGRLLAFQIGPDGKIHDPDNDGNLTEDAYWDSDNSGTFASYGSRRIYTWTGEMTGTPPTPTANAGVAFNTLSALSSSQQAALIDQDHLDWIRGDRSNEQASGGTFRNRSYILGDIVNSNPAYVAVNNFGFENLPSGTPGQSSYIAFRNANRSRTSMLYVGANDGMLHAFDASTGVEQFAFIPKAVFPNLANLANPSYTHKYFVDGSPLAGDAYIGGAWKTILVGSAGAGGRSIFALDVTTPGSFDQTKVLWEFTDTDLGYPIGQFVQPAIGRMQNGEWAAVFGNGYESDNHKAFLYVVNLTTGALIKKIDTGAGSSGSPNGLAGPVLLADDYRTIKYAYAGDLLGNLWKFDLSGSDPGAWDVAFKAGTTPKPLFQARYVSGSTEIIEPITSPPEIGLHPDSGYLIFFGTGKFFETGDNLSNTVQSLYGIWDKDDGNSSCTSLSDSCVYPTNRSTLQQQTILATTSANGNNWRVVSSNSLDWNSKRGWYIDLISGERSVSVPLVRHGRAIFTTIIPSTDICSGGGTSWIMEVDMRSGGRTSDSVFDVNKDAKFDAGDSLTVGGIGTVPASGIQSTVGIINTPAVISAGSIEYKYAAGSSGGLQKIDERGSESAGGRQSWRQLR